MASGAAGRSSTARTPARGASRSPRPSSRCRPPSWTATREHARAHGSEAVLSESLWPEEATAQDEATAGGHPRRLIIRTDGAARGNPGPASLGAVLIDAASAGARHPSAEPYATLSEYLGIRTNNVAEYTGVVRALEVANDLGAREVELLLDSKLIVEQLHGRWKVKDVKLQPLWGEARRRLAALDRWSAQHVPRAQNHAADALANEAIDRAHAGGPTSVVRVRDGQGARARP